jgi:hypothetical protein
MSLHEAKHLSLVWQQRFMFHKYDGTTEELFVRLGASPEKMYMVSNNMTSNEFNRQIEDLEAIPGLFVSARDAKALADDFFKELDIDLPAQFHHFFSRPNEILSELAYYRTLNKLIDQIEPDDDYS